MKNYLLFATLTGAGVGTNATELLEWECEDPVAECKGKGRAPEHKPWDTYLNQELWEMACNNAESFGVYPLDHNMPEDEEYDEDMYSEDICGIAVPFDPEKHSGQFCGNWRNEVRGELLQDENGFYYVDTSEDAVARTAHQKRVKAVQEVESILAKDLEVLENKLRLLGEAIADKRKHLTDVRCELAKLENE